MDAFLELADLAADALRLGRQFRPLPLEQLAVVDVLDGLAGERLLAEVQLGNLRFRPQDVPTRRFRAAEAIGQLLLAVGDGPGAFLPAFLDLPQPGVQVAEPFLALGQIDLGFGGFAAAGLPLRLQGADLLGQSGQAAFHLGERGIELGAPLAGLGQPAQRRFVLLLGGLKLGFQHAALLVELRPALLGGRNLQPLLAHGVQGLAMFGRAPLELLLLPGDLLLEADRARLAPVDLAFQLGQLRLQGAELAAPGDQAGGHLPRPDDQRAVGLEQFARQGDEMEPRAGRAGQVEGMAEFLDDPGPAQQPPGQRDETRLGLDEAVGAAEHAGPPFKVDFRPGRRGRRAVEP